MDSEKPELTIDLVLDFVCPWCFVGYRGLEWATMALSFNYDVTRRYRPFRLYPDPVVGSRAAFLEQRYGDLSATRKALAAAMRDVGLDFDPALPETIPDTTNAHLVMRWAQDEGMAEPVIKGIYEAYWHHGENISRPEVLRQVVAAAGMEADAVGDVLGGRDDSDTIRQEAAELREGGVTNVPTFVVNEQVGFYGALPKADLLAEITALANETMGTV